MRKQLSANTLVNNLQMRKVKIDCKQYEKQATYNYFFIKIHMYICRCVGNAATLLFVKRIVALCGRGMSIAAKC